jgi:hypothetical protein
VSTNETVKCLERLKTSLEAAAQLSNPGKVETVEALRSGIQIAVDAVTRELLYQHGKAAAAGGAAPAQAVPVPAPRVPQPKMVERKCNWCKGLFLARAADVKRGWGKYCSKSCKASRQEKRTGQYRAISEEERGEFSNAHLFSNEEHDCNKD